MPPLFLMNSNAFAIYPPLQPLLPVSTSQSMSSCSDRDTNLPVLILVRPSTAAVAEKAQQLPAMKAIVPKLPISAGNAHANAMNSGKKKLLRKEWAFEHGTLCWKII